MSEEKWVIYKLFLMFFIFIFVGCSSKNKPSSEKLINEFLQKHEIQNGDSNVAIMVKYISHENTANRLHKSVLGLKRANQRPVVSLLDKMRIMMWEEDVCESLLDCFIPNVSLIAMTHIDDGRYDFEKLEIAIALRQEVFDDSVLSQIKTLAADYIEAHIQQNTDKQAEKWLKIRDKILELLPYIDGGELTLEDLRYDPNSEKDNRPSCWIGK